LFRLLTGNAPFPAGNGAAAVMMAHLHQPAPRVTDLNPGLPPALDAVIATAMAKDPAHRFAAASGFAAAAQAALRDAPPHIVRAVLPAGAVDVTPATGTPRWPPPATGAPPPRPPGRRRRAILAATAVAVVGVAVVALLISNRSEPAAAPPMASPSAASAPPPPMLFPVASLPSLLHVAEIQTVLRDNLLTLTNADAALLDDAGQIDDKQCAGAWEPAQASVYAATGTLGVQVQTFDDNEASARQTTAIAAVIGYPSQEAADNAVSAQLAEWAPCADHTVTVTPAGSAPIAVKLDAPGGVYGAIRVLDQHPENTPALHCQRAVMSKHNVLVDVGACSPSVPDPAKEISRIIGGNVPG
jgi:serine/threonine-protein kinase